VVADATSPVDDALPPPVTVPAGTPATLPPPGS
jgi:hypothetical protein